MLETLDYTIRIVSIPTFIYFDLLYIYIYIASCIYIVWRYQIPTITDEFYNANFAVLVQRLRRSFTACTSVPFLVLVSHGLLVLYQYNRWGPLLDWWLDNDNFLHFSNSSLITCLWQYVVVWLSTFASLNMVLDKIRSSLII